MMKKAVFNWSGGKDSSLSLYHVLKDKEYDVYTLLTTVNEKFGRISMHGVREVLLERQAEALGIPLTKLYLPEMPGMSEYEDAMRQQMEALKTEGVTHSVFGDIFLEDLKNYRVKKLHEVGLEAGFPIWKRPTEELVKEFIDLGFKTIVVCVDEKHLDERFVGRVIDQSFLDDLPEGVDPCGENGEFHTFVFDGPIFSESIKFEKGEIVYRKYEPVNNSSDDVCGTDEAITTGFWYCDLLPV